MRFNPAFLDEIRARLPVSTLVGRKVRLKKQGREWRGLSPFTSEKTPSFYVNDQKGRWFDFSAGKNGNIFDFIMETERLTFPEAVEKLAGEAGLALPTVTPDDLARDAKRTTTLDVLEEATRYFEGQLKGRAGESARAYLAGRNIGAAIQHEFRIGYASRERYALRDHLANKGMSLDAMIDGGLLVHGEGIEVPYDRFRDRVIFPIGDRSGRTIAFGGRALDPAAPAKYLNSPETGLFHKGAGLYNHHRARRAAGETGRVIAVEGYIDVIAMAEAGFPETVAPLGTALTLDQCALLWQMSEEPILCFDGDAAGRKAAHRAIETALPLIGDRRTLRFALLPDGLDPDDLLRSGGRTAVEATVSAALPLVEVLWRRERDSVPLATPEQRTGLLRRLEAAGEAIGDSQLRKAYSSELKGRAFEHFRELRPQRPLLRGDRRGVKPSTAGAPVISESLARSGLLGGDRGGMTREAVILTALVDFPDLVEPLYEEIAALSVGAPDADRLRHVLLDIGHDHDLVRETLDAAIDSSGCRPIVDRLARQAGALRLGAVLNGEASSEALHGLRQALALHRRPAALSTDLRVAQADLAADLSDRNLHRLRDLRAQLSSKDGLEASTDQSVGTPEMPEWGR